MLSHVWLLLAFLAVLAIEPAPGPDQPSEPAVSSEPAPDSPAAETGDDEECREPRWAVDQPVIRDLVAWRDEPLKCVFTVRNEGDADLQLHVEPG